jgi:hypothetical protein
MQRKAFDIVRAQLLMVVVGKTRYGQDRQVPHQRNPVAVQTFTRSRTALQSLPSK